MSQQVLVLDCYEHTLTVIRSLAHAGFEVILGVSAEDLERGYVHVSRFVSSTWLHSDIVEEAEAFESEFLNYLQQNPKTKTIFPVGENSVRKLSAMRDELPADVLIAMPENAAVETCLHKPKILESPIMVVPNAGTDFCFCAVVAQQILYSIGNRVVIKTGLVFCPAIFCKSSRYAIRALFRQHCGNQ